MKELKIICVMVLLAVFASCTSVAPGGPEPVESVAEAPTTAAAPMVKPRPHPDDYPAAPFSSDTLYELLVAEVAGYRGQYDVALQNYVDTAIRTRDPGVAERATRLASYMKRGEDALKTAQIWAAEAPEDIDAHRHAADQLMRVGDLEGAVHHLEAVKRLGGFADFPMFAYRAAGLDEVSRQGLLRVISRMLEEFPSDEQLIFSKAVLLVQSGRHAEALDMADQLLEEKQDINVIILKVNALKDLDRTDEAVTYLEQAIAGTGENRRLRLIYARLLFEVDRLGDAFAQYEIVHKQSPTDGDILFALALISMERGEDATAQGFLQQMVRWNRRAGEAHFYLGSIAEKQGDFETAIREYRQVGDGYEYLPAQSRIASMLFDQGREAEARNFLSSARAENPARFMELGMVEVQLLTERDQPEAALALADEMVAREPANIDLLYFRAMTAEKFGHLDILERDLNRILEMDPQNADAMNALGYTLTDKTDRHDEALALIQNALAIKPGEAAFIDSLGWVMYRLERFDEALTNLRRALELFPNDEVAAHLGEVLWVVGQKTEAGKVWDAALEAKPDSEILKRVIQRFIGN